MANETREIKILIRADGSAAISGLRGVEGALGDLDRRQLSFTESFKKNWIAIGAAVTGAYLALNRIWDTMEYAAQLSERMDTLDQYTARYGMTAVDLTAKISANSRGLIGVAAAAEVATDALMKGFSPQQVAQMASWSETLAESSAEAMSTADAFRMMEQSLTAARERGIVKFMGAEIDLASAMGRRAETMSKAEKANALFNLMSERMGQIERENGPHIDSAADRMERFTNSMNQMKFYLGQLLLLVGQPLMAVFNVALTLAYGVAGGIATVISYFTKLTDLLKITHEQAPIWEKRANEMYSNSAAQAQQAVQNVQGAWSQFVGGISGRAAGVGRGGDDGSAKRLEQLEDLVRKYAQERELIMTSELDREIVKLDHWFEEQVKKLQDLGAADAQYSALVETYTAKNQAVRLAAAAKVAEFYRSEMEKGTEEGIAAEKERTELEFAARASALKSRHDQEDAMAKAWSENESERIRRRATAERESLALQQEKIIALITENTTFQETNRLMAEYWRLERDIEASKGREVYELDVRRVELHREINDLTREQSDLLREQQFARMQESMGKAGAGDLGRGLEEMLRLGKGMENPWEGTDVYSRDFQAWSAIQDQKIIKMEEDFAAEMELRRTKGEAEFAIDLAMAEKRAALSDQYRAYESRAAQTLESQKLGFAQASFGTLASMAQAAYALSNNRSKAAFRAYQAMAIGETIIATGSASMKAFDVMLQQTKNYYVAAAAAAAVIVMGASRVAMIAAQKPEGGGSMSGAGGSSFSGGGGGGGMAVPAAPTQAWGEEQKPSVVVQVHIYNSGYMGADGDALARDLVPRIQKAMEDGVR